MFAKYSQRTKTTNDQTLSCELETLEDRQMLAGNINVALSTAGDVFLRGDARANSVSLEVADSGDLLIEGRSGTQITYNGSRAASHVILLADSGKIAGNVNIVSRGGDDFIRFSGLDVGGNFRARTAGGEDTVLFLDGRIDGKVNVATGGRLDDVLFTDAEVGGDTFVALGGGNKFIFGDTFRSDQSMFESDLVILGGGGIDSASIQGSTVMGHTDLLLGGHFGFVHIVDSQLESVLVTTSFRDDVIEIIDSQIDGPVTLLSSFGDDDFYVENSTFNSSVFVNGGFGSNDSWELAGTNSFAISPQLIGIEVFA